MAIFFFFLKIHCHFRNDYFVTVNYFVMATVEFCSDDCNLGMQSCFTSLCVNIFSFYHVNRQFDCHKSSFLNKIKMFQLSYLICLKLIYTKLSRTSFDFHPAQLYSSDQSYPLPGTYTVQVFFSTFKLQNYIQFSESYVLSKQCSSDIYVLILISFYIVFIKMV